jgi:hypothetical protein
VPMAALESSAWQHTVAPDLVKAAHAARKHWPLALSSSPRRTLLARDRTEETMAIKTMRRLLGQFEDLADARPDAVDIAVAGAEDDPGLWPMSRTQSNNALRAALQECGTGAFEHGHTTTGTIWRVPNLDTTRVALERALASVPHLRGTITAARGD